jgi:Transposase DDE domain
MRKHTPFPAPSTTDSVPLMNHVFTFFQEILLSCSPAQSSQPKRGRPETVTVPHLLLACLLAVFRQSFSPSAVCRILLLEAVGSFAPLVTLTRQAVRQRLLAFGLQPFSLFLQQIQAHLQERSSRISALSLAAFAPMVVALDECKLSAVARLCDEAASLPKDSPYLLVGKLAALFDLRRQQWVHMQFLSDAVGNGTVASLLLIEQLAKGSLILADLGYYGFAWFQYLTTQGYYWVSRLKSSSSYSITHLFYQDGETLDALIWLGTYRSNQYPDVVRLVQFRQGATLSRYVTNVLDPCVLPMADVPRLYARRWDIELAFKLIKQALGLRLFWACEPILVLQQVLLTLLIAQVLHFFQLEIAAEAGVDPFEVSLDILLKLLPQARWPCPYGVIQSLVSHAHSFHLIRPSRRLILAVPTPPLEVLQPVPPGFQWHRPWKHTVRKKPRHPRTTDPWKFRLVPLLLI